MNTFQIKDAFNDIILGNGVKRSVHELIFDGVDYSALFLNCLNQNSYLYAPLRDIQIEVGIRYPGFYILDSVAYFGHLFWEVFSDRRKRKIWGSVVRNEKGDWKYIFPGNSSNIVYLNLTKGQTIDVFYLT